MDTITNCELSSESGALLSSFFSCNLMNKLVLKIFLIYGTVVIGSSLFFVVIYTAAMGNLILASIIFYLLILYCFVMFMVVETYKYYCDHDRPLPRVLIAIQGVFLRIKAGTVSETISHAFAVTNLIVAVLSSVASVCLMIYGIIAIGVAIAFESYYESFFEDVVKASSYGYTVVPMFFSSITLAFALLLVTGLKEKKANRVRIYFVYGVVVEALSVFFTVVFVCLPTDNPIIPLVSLCLCGLYALVLFHINKTVKMFKQEIYESVNTEEESTENQITNYEQNIVLLQNEMFNQKSKEDEPPKTEEV